jgi:hypothetical protein
MKKYKTQLIFFILDEKGFAWGIAPSKVQARVQIAWFLPKGNQYRIDPQVVPVGTFEQKTRHNVVSSQE